MLTIAVTIVFLFVVGYWLALLTVGPGRTYAAIALAAPTGLALFLFSAEMIFRLSNQPAQSTHLWTVAALLAGLGVVLAIMLRRDATRDTRAGIAALVVAGIVAVLLYLPALRFGWPAFAYRVGPDDAFVNLSLAANWRGLNWDTIRTYLSLAGGDWDNPQLTAPILDEAPSALYSTRFIRFEVRHATSFLIAAISELGGVPGPKAYVVLFPSIGAISAMVALAWVRAERGGWLVAGLAGLSLAAGWFIIVREADNSNQIVALPMVLAMWAMLAGLSESSVEAAARQGIAAALFGAAAITAYPEIGGIAAAGTAAAALLSLTHRSSRRAVLAFSVTAAIAGVLLLIVNGQFGIVLRWIEILRTQQMVPEGLFGLTSAFLFETAPASYLGFRLPAGWFVPVWLVAGVMLLGLVVVARGALRSPAIMAGLLYLAACASLAVYFFQHQQFYESGRAISYAGMVAVGVVAASIGWLGARWSRTAGVAVLALWVMASMTLTGYLVLRGSTTSPILVSASFPERLPDLDSIMSAARRAAADGGSISLFLPPIAGHPDQTRFSVTGVHLAVLDGDAKALSGFIIDNVDERLVTLPPSYAAERVSSVVVSAYCDPFDEGSVPGDRIFDDGGFRVYHVTADTAAVWAARLGVVAPCGQPSP